MEKQLLSKENELPNGAVMSKEVALKELESWFDYRKMKESIRHNIDDDLDRDVMLDKMVEGFVYGLLVFDPDNGRLIQKLEFPVENESKTVSLSELTWKPRFKDSDLTEPMRGVKNNDSSGRMKAYMQAITGTVKTKLGSLDYSDYSLSQTIVSYFLL